MVFMFILLVLNVESYDSHDLIGFYITELVIVKENPIPSIAFDLIVPKVVHLSWPILCPSSVVLG